MNGIWEKVAIFVLSAFTGFALQAFVMGERLIIIEKTLDSVELQTERLDSSREKMWETINRLEFNNRSNRTFIQRECHRNNIHDDKIGIPRLNNCDQTF